MRKRTSEAFCNFSLAALLFGSPAVCAAGVNHWTTLGLGASSVCQLLVDPYDSATLYAGTCTAGLFKSTNSGLTWLASAEGLTCVPVTGIAVSGPAAVYVSSSDRNLASACAGIFKSTDGGQQWSVLNDSLGSPSGPVLIDPQNPTILHILSEFVHPFHASDWAVMESQDGGLTWSSSSLGLPPGYALSNLIAARTHLYVVADTIYQRQDSGTYWSQLPGGQFQGYRPDLLAADPFRPSVLFTKTAISGVLKSTDSGYTWNATALVDPTVTALVCDPFNVNTFYALDDTGIQGTTDDGATWAPLNAGLDNAVINALAFDPLHRRILAASSVGVLEYEFAAPGTCASDATTLCLAGGRFMVQAQWTDFNGNTGAGTVVPGATSNNSGVMWFFSPDNWELLIKVLDGCAVNGHYWVLGAAATNVAYTIQVTDTQTGDIRTYTNPLGTVSPAITDTSAFGSCP